MLQGPRTANFDVDWAADQELNDIYSSVEGMLAGWPLEGD